MPRLPEPYYSYVTTLAALARAETARVPVLGATPVKFNMNEWGRGWIIDDPNSCGTAACIAGLCQLAFDEPIVNISYERGTRLEPHYSAQPFTFARHFLGLSEVDARYLFSLWARDSSEREVTLNDITPEIAAQMLVNYAETGILDWEKAFADVGLDPDDYFFRDVDWNDY